MSAAPTKYVRTTSFTAFSQSNPDQQQPGASIDTELNNLKSTTDQTIDRLAEIQRGDGMLGNQTVHVDALAASTKAMMASASGTPRGAWVTLSSYAIKDLVSSGGVTYIATVAHVAGASFATDLAAGKWMIFAQAGYNQNLNTGDGPTFAGLTVSNDVVIGGVTKFSNGSAAAPSLSFTTDPDTGFYRVSANALGIACNGANVGAFSPSGLILGQTIYSRGEQAIGSASSTNYPLQAIAAYLGSLIVISWNGGTGFALCWVTPAGVVSVITSSNGAGGNNAFDTVNNFASNGGNGVAFFNNGGFMTVQTKSGYSGGAINVHKFGG